MQQILTERPPGKTKQMTNWSVSTVKGKLEFFRFKIVKYKTRTLNRKFEIQPIPVLHNISLNANNILITSDIEVKSDHRSKFPI